MIELAIAAAVVMLLAAAAWTANNAVGVTRYRVDVGRPPSPPAVESTSVPANASVPTPRLRILQVSDVHGKRFGRGSRRLLRKIDELDFDVIAVTGDLVTGSVFAHGLRPALELANELVKRAPVFYTPGNHETTSRQFVALLAGLRRAGVRILRRDATEIEVRGTHYTILGLDDLEFFEGAEAAYRAALAELLERRDLETATRTILVSHRPGIFSLYAKTGVDLVLTGHVHGGQFRIPGLGGVISPDQGPFPRYDAGVYERGGTSMVVSRGLGPSVIPLRINNRPELVLVELSG